MIIRYNQNKNKKLDKKKNLPKLVMYGGVESR